MYSIGLSCLLMSMGDLNTCLTLAQLCSLSIQKQPSLQLTCFLEQNIFLHNVHGFYNMANVLHQEDRI